MNTSPLLSTYTKSLFYLFILAFAQQLSTGVSGQGQNCKSQEKTGWELENLRGKIENLRVEEVHYDYGKHHKEFIEQISFDPEGTYIRRVEPLGRNIDYRTQPKTIYIFDGSCQTIERRGLVSGFGMTRTLYSYTKSGKLKEEAIYDIQEHLLWKRVSDFDDRDRQVETNETIQVHPEHFTPLRYDVYRNTRSLYKYDEAGNQIEGIAYKYDGTLYANYSMAYDATKRLVRKTSTDGKGRLIHQSIYVFDSDGIVREEYEYDSSTYEGLDKLAPATIDSGFGKFQNGTKIVYDYDKLNNWVRKSEFDILQDGSKTSYKLQMTTLRTIVYFQ